MPHGFLPWSLLWCHFECGQELLVQSESTGENLAMTLEDYSYGMSEKGRSVQTLSLVSKADSLMQSVSASRLLVSMVWRVFSTNQRHTKDKRIQCEHHECSVLIAADTS